MRRVTTRRDWYRACKRVLVEEAARRVNGSRRAVERWVRAFLRGKTKAWLRRVTQRPALAAAVSLTIVAGVSTNAEAVELSDIVLDSNPNGFVINGIDAGDESGYSVSGAGDVNGDGLADLIVGAHRAHPGGDSYAGESYVVFGKAVGTAVELSDVAAGIGGFVINGIDASDRSGRSVSGAGDVNGDGLTDLIVGAYRADPGGDAVAGESYVVFGKADGTAVELSDVATGIGGFVINGIDTDDRSGTSVSGAGDVNGDGLADLIVGAYRADAGGDSYAGESYVVFGKAGGTAVELSDVATGIGGFVINGIDAQDLSGRSVSGAGDVNGDGLADLIVGARSADAGGDLNAGESYVVFGKEDGAPVELATLEADGNGFVINGIDPADSSGQSVSRAGDVNGDGLADFIVGAQGASPGGDSAAGESYVVFGKAGGTAVELSDVAAGIGGFVINGIDAYDASGYSVSGAGDVNGDGLADLIVGAPGADPGGDSYAGESYVVFGKTDGAPVELETLVADGNGILINGVGMGDLSGAEVSGAGDVNGDGIADLIVGAPGADAGGDLNAGESYVLFSTESPPLSAVYQGRSRAGDGPGGGLVPPVTIGDSRVTIDFSDEDFGGDAVNEASLETVVLTRSSAAVTNLPGTLLADVTWEIVTNRVNFDSPSVTFMYTQAEVMGLDESALKVFKAPSVDGPWVEVPSVVDIDKNKITGTGITEFSYFVIGTGAPLPTSWYGTAAALFAAGCAALLGWLPWRKRKYAKGAKS